ncbi:ABC transporter ATP-binding protein [Allokutzneria sp. A3M-2-11 16]|uniref:ABC transporter ATP-binding protein n=1 Tax=Allokutzneria sp. A3M-2-11 16 TaxID=2962043 RepID=UPI0020B8668D|nr:ABC transporter ATP-binding protein [Allokutzneria sp. A3M-2-11 16]MCP3804878.1 ABC transporter ATP-binding protein [Allokutzneria sp. A3M-2-11 16]
MENEVVVSIRDLRKSYGAKVAVDGISLDVRRGEVFGVLGPNGAGKTTTVECAAGLREPDGGTVRVLGLDPVTDPAVRHRVGVQLQHAVLPNRMKVREAMRIFASAYPRHTDPGALLAEWGLAEQHGTAFAALSGGQRQRLFIALALLGDPEVVVLDELTTGLDPAARRDTWSLVRALRTRGVSVLLVTHAMDEAERLCDRLVVITGGRVAAAGTPAELRGAHQSMESAYLALTEEAA